MAWLTIEVESRDGSYRERIRFAGAALTIGRDEECDVPIGHSTVSAVHARIVRSRRKLRVEDAGSRNGVLLNRIPVGTAAVHVGDVLTLGRDGPKVHLVEFDPGPALLPRVILTVVVLLGTAGAIHAMRLERGVDWLGRARSWLPRYEGARWSAPEIPADRIPREEGE